MKVPTLLPERRQQDLARLDATPLDARIGTYFYKQGSPYRARHANGSVGYELSVLDAEPWSADYTSDFVEELYNSLTDTIPTNTQPDLLVTVPLAINHESAHQIDTVCSQIEKAAKPLGSVAVLVWANVKYDGLAPDRTIRSIMKAAQAKTTTLYAQLKNRPRSNVHYTTGFQAGDKVAMRMSDIRYSFMAIALERARRLGYDASLPVMWIDADTTHISKNAFVSTVEALKTHAFAHPRTHFSAEWAADFAPNDISRAFILKEILERRRKATVGVSYRDNDYPEESGLAFTIDTYLKARGVNTSVPMNEAPGLVHAYAANVCTGAPERVEPYDFFADVAQARLTISGRRVIDLVSTHGTAGLAMMHDNTGRYVPWCNTSTAKKVPLAVVTPDMAVHGHQDVLTMLPPASARRMDYIAQRLWGTTTPT